MANIEYVLWGLPKGESDRLHEKVLYTQGKTLAEVEAIKTRASADGWHSFRIQLLDLNERPDFTALTNETFERQSVTIRKGRKI